MYPYEGTLNNETKQSQKQNPVTFSWLTNGLYWDMCLFVYVYFRMLMLHVLRIAEFQIMSSTGI